MDWLLSILKGVEVTNIISLFLPSFNTFSLNLFASSLSLWFFSSHFLKSSLFLQQWLSIKKVCTKEKWTQNITLNQEAIYNWFLLGEIFSSVKWYCINHIPRQTSCSWVVDQHKTDFVFLDAFCLLYLCCLCLFGFT